jgi:hypothetical protein
MSRLRYPVTISLKKNSGADFETIVTRTAEPAQLQQHGWRRWQTQNASIAA